MCYLSTSLRSLPKHRHSTNFLEPLRSKLGKSGFHEVDAPKRIVNSQQIRTQVEYSVPSLSHFGSSFPPIEFHHPRHTKVVLAFETQNKIFLLCSNTQSRQLRVVVMHESLKSWKHQSWNREAKRISMMIESL